MLATYSSFREKVCVERYVYVTVVFVLYICMHACMCAYVWCVCKKYICNISVVRVWGM